jgi:hypothetical protein
MIEDPDSGPATDAQRALVAQLCATRPSWADQLNGAEWENCWDLADTTKLVTRTEASSVVAALLGLAPE